MPIQNKGIMAEYIKHVIEFIQDQAIKLSKFSTKESGHTKRLLMMLA